MMRFIFYIDSDTKIPLNRIDSGKTKTPVKKSLCADSTRGPRTSVEETMDITKQQTGVNAKN